MRWSSPTRRCHCFALTLSGVAAVRRGETTAGFADLDEAMLPVLAGQVEPVWAGDVYCSVIHLCEHLGDLSRMRAWTDSLERWAAPLSETFLYAGVTRVHQLQLISAEGDWDVVEEELGGTSESPGRCTRLARRCRLLRARRGAPAAGRRRRRPGGLREGPRARHDHRARRGLPVARGGADRRSALAALRVAMSEMDRLQRARLLLPAVEIALETGDTTYAATLADELTRRPPCSTHQASWPGPPRPGPPCSSTPAALRRPWGI